MNRDSAGLKVLCKLLLTRMYPILGAAALLVLGTLPILAHLFRLDSAIIANLNVLAILVSSLWLISYFIPFEFMLSQSNKPQWQTALNFFVVTTNIALNVWLIPSMGILGAALATGCSYFFMGLYLHTLLLRHVEVDLLRMRFKPEIGQCSGHDRPLD